MTKMMFSAVPILGTLATLALSALALGVNVPPPPTTRIIGYAPGPHGESIQYSAHEDEGKYSREYVLIVPPADTDRQRPEGEKAIVLNRDDITRTSSQDFTRLQFLGQPAPFEDGTVITVTKPDNLVLYKADKTIIPDEELTFTVPDTSDKWLAPLAADGEVDAWARGKTDWHAARGGNITLTIVRSSGRKSEDVLKLVPRRHIVIVVGGSSLNRDNRNAIYIDDTDDKIYFPAVNLGPNEGAAKAFNGRVVTALSDAERNALEKALKNKLTRAHDNSPDNFVGRGRTNARTLVDDECEVHVIVNIEAAGRRNNRDNVSKGLTLPGGKEKIFDPTPTWDVIPALDLTTTKYQTPSGKGKSNPLIKIGDDQLSERLRQIVAEKVRIDDLVYFGHAGGSFFFEYGSYPEDNDGYKLRTDKSREGQASAKPEGVFKATAVSEFLFNRQSEPTLYHHGCYGWRNDQSSFCAVAKATGKLAKSPGAEDKTDFGSFRMMQLNIVCDARITKLEVPKASGGVLYTEDPGE